MMDTSRRDDCHFAFHQRFRQGTPRHSFGLSRLDTSDEFFFEIHRVRNESGYDFIFFPFKYFHAYSKPLTNNLNIALFHFNLVTPYNLSRKRLFEGFRYDHKRNKIGFYPAKRLSLIDKCLIIIIYLNRSKKDQGGQIWTLKHYPYRIFHVDIA